VGGDGGVDQVAAKSSKARKGAILVRAGEPAVTDHIRDEDRSQFSALAHSAHCRRPSRPFQTVPATALGGERKTAKAISLIGLGMAACPCCTDEIRGGREMQARHSVISLAALARCIRRSSVVNNMSAPVLVVSFIRPLPGF
jgi:hypothetical protein